MRSALLHSLWVTFAAGAALRTPDYVSYDGFKVFRVKTGRQLAYVKEKLATIPYEQWNHDEGTNLDVVIAPEHVAAFESFGFNSKCMHDNLGASIPAESRVKSNWKRQDNGSTDAWFDSYHPYEDHIEYFKELHASFPNQSEWVSSGTSYEGRDLYGLHLYGAGGPGKPAVLWHGTVHAREWISAPVSSTKNLVRIVLTRSRLSSI